MHLHQLHQASVQAQQRRPFSGRLLVHRDHEESRETTRSGENHQDRPTTRHRCHGLNNCRTRSRSSKPRCRRLTANAHLQLRLARRSRPSADHVQKTDTFPQARARVRHRQRNIRLQRQRDATRGDAGKHRNEPARLRTKQPNLPDRVFFYGSHRCARKLPDPEREKHDAQQAANAYTRRCRITTSKASAREQLAIPADHHFRVSPSARSRGSALHPAIVGSTVGPHTVPNGPSLASTKTKHRASPATQACTAAPSRSRTPGGRSVA